MSTTGSFTDVPKTVRLPSRPKSAGRLVLRWEPWVITCAMPRATIIVPSVTMMEGTRNPTTSSALSPPMARAPAMAQANASQIGKPKPVDSGLAPSAA